jgi:chitin disaccharide deacetylase
LRRKKSRLIHPTEFDTDFDVSERPMAKAGEQILIINGDDLGYTRGVNLAIKECCVEGVLRSATLMANGCAFDHAVAMLANMENLDVGVHLVLTELPSVSSPTKICGLADESGCLPGTPRELVASLVGGRISRESVRRELSSQISKVLDHGLRPTHLDSHKHVHVIPQVLETVIELAHKFSIPWVRNPFDEAPFFGLGRLIDTESRTTFCIQHLKAKLLAAFRTSFGKRIGSTRLRTPDHFFGISLTGIWNEAVMIRLLDELPPGVTEWMNHPGDCDADLYQMKTRLLEQREKERDLLTSSQFREQIARRGITLSSFRRGNM